MSTVSPKKVGLAISSGFFRSTAAIGVIQVLEEEGIPVDMVAGTSGGAGIAAAYATGNLAAVEKSFTDRHWTAYWQIIFEPTVPRQGLLKGLRTREFFKEFITEETFATTKKKLFITATDLRSLSPVTMSEGNIVEAVHASGGILGLWAPVKWGDKVLADGAHFHLIPSQPLYEHGADYVIAVDTSQPPSLSARAAAQVYQYVNRRTGEQPLLTEPEVLTKDLDIVDLVKRAIRLTGSNIDKLYYHSYPYDILIQPRIQHLKRWDIRKVQEMIALGRKAAEKAIPHIKQDLGL